MNAPRPQRPGLYYPKVPLGWWLKRPGYIRFMIREVTSVFIAIFLVVLLAQIYQVAQGPEAYAAGAAKLRSPGWIVFHVVALAFALYHTVTWFKLTGVVQVVRLGAHTVPPALVVAATFAAWGVVSLFILYWLLGRS